MQWYDQEVEPDDTYPSTPSLITATLKLLLTLAGALAGDGSRAFLHTLLTDEVFVIPPVEYCPNRGVLWKLGKAMYGLKQLPRMWQHLALNAWNLTRTCTSSLNNIATWCAPSTTCWFSVTKTTAFWSLLRAGLKLQLFSAVEKQDAIGLGVSESLFIIPSFWIPTFQTC